jgi:hypothetical protein
VDAGVWHSRRVAPTLAKENGMSAESSASTPWFLRLSSRTLPPLLLAIIVALCAIHLGLQYDRFHGSHTPWEIQQLFDLDEEQAVPNWYSSATLGLAALLAALIGARSRRDGEPDWKRWRAMGWILLYCSFDEVAGVHETFNSLSPISWTIPFGLLALAVGIWMLPWVWRLPAETRWGIILSGIVYVGGAVGVEVVTSHFFDESNKRQFTYALFTVVEEGGEMLGVWIAIRTLLRYMERKDAAALGVGTRT